MKKRNKIVSWNGLVRMLYCSTIWYEDKCGDDGACRIDDLDFASKSTYGKTWRVWLHKPTPDELAANPWPEVE